jgi:hypothetical protein
MAFNLLSIGTDGYLCKDSDRNVLAIATRGYIGCGGIIEPPAPDKPLSQPGSGSGWSGKIDTGKAIKLDLKDPGKRIKNQNDAILAVIKSYVKCKDENIL